MNKGIGYSVLGCICLLAVVSANAQQAEPDLPGTLAYEIKVNDVETFVFLSGGVRFEYSVQEDECSAYAADYSLLAVSSREAPQDIRFISIPDGTAKTVPWNPAWEPCRFFFREDRPLELFTSILITNANGDIGYTQRVIAYLEPETQAFIAAPAASAQPLEPTSRPYVPPALPGYVEGTAIVQVGSTTIYENCPNQTLPAGAFSCPLPGEIVIYNWQEGRIITLLEDLHVSALGTGALEEAHWRMMGSTSMPVFPSLAISGSERYLLYNNPEGGLKLVDLETLTASEIVFPQTLNTFLHVRLINGIIEWSADESVIGFRLPAGRGMHGYYFGYYTIGTGTLRVTRQSYDVSPFSGSWAWSPQKDAIVYIDGANDLHLLDLATESTLRLDENVDFIVGWAP